MTDPNQQRRLDELREKASLTDAEFRELVTLSPVGSHVELPNLALAGLHDMQQALANVLEIGNRTRRAFASGCYVEVIALRSQSAELFLRLYLAAKAQPPKALDPDDRRPLGALIDAARKVGFDPACLTTLQAFNADRRSGLHRFLLGATSYDSLRVICERSSGLTEAVVKAIAGELGIVVNPPI